MQDWRVKSLDRPAPSELRVHCQYFSQLGWALFAQMLSMLTVQVVVSALVGLLAPALLSDPIFLWTLSVVSAYGVGFPAFCLMIRRVDARSSELGRPLGPARFFQVYLIVLALMYLTNMATLAFTALIGLLRGETVVNPVEQMESYPVALTTLLGCVIAPITEELMFRRLLLNRLRPYGEKFAVVASALCFGLFHGNLNQVFYAFAIGLVFAYVALRTGRLWQVMLLHAMVNSISVLILPLLEPLGTAGENLLSLLVFMAIVVGIVFLVALRREVRFAPSPSPLSAGWTWRVFFENPGMACFCVLFVALCVIYLLPQG